MLNQKPRLILNRETDVSSHIPSLFFFHGNPLLLTVQMGEANDRLRPAVCDAGCAKRRNKRERVSEFRRFVQVPRV